MTNREKSLGWVVDLTFLESDLAQIHRHLGTPPHSGLWHAWRHGAQSESYFYLLCQYLLGEDLSIRQATTLALAAAKECFFGSWKAVAPSGNGSDLPPSREYWHQCWAQDESFVQSACVASAINDWNFVRRLAEYMSTIRWSEIEYKPGRRYLDLEDGREESAWRLILAGIIHGHRFDDELRELVDIVESGRSKREKLLLGFLKAIVENDDARRQKAADAYIDYYLRSERKAKPITAKVMAEGTLLVNYASHLGRPVALPSKLGDHYFHLTEGSKT